MTHEIRLLNSEEELRAAYPVMVQLRPKYAENAFVEQALRQFTTGYYLAACLLDGRPVSLAGYRYVENLHAGFNMYVDDLVTDEAIRGSGTAKALFEWLVSEAKKKGCGQLHLDSGVQRHRAHRFYLDRGMIISSHHFQMLLD